MIDPTRGVRLFYIKTKMTTKIQDEEQHIGQGLAGVANPHLPPNLTPQVKSYSWYKREPA
jgi:hypothetical protein